MIMDNETKTDNGSPAEQPKEQAGEQAAEQAAAAPNGASNIPIHRDSFLFPPLQTI